MDVHSAYPLLLPQNLAETHYKGLISVKYCRGQGTGEEYLIEIRMKDSSSLKGAIIDCEWKLKKILIGQESLIKERLEQSSNLVDFLAEFTRIVECQLENGKQTLVTSPLPRFYDEILSDIEALGWDRLSYIDTSFTQLHLVTTDSNQRQHTLRVRLHAQHPNKAPEYSSDLPITFDFNWIKQSRLSNLYTQFTEVVERFQDFWNVLDELDVNCLILEPDQPSRSAAKRRIALGNAASLQIEVDSVHPRLVPDCRFLGSDQVVRPLKENFNRNLAGWNPEGSLLENLQSALSIEFPSPRTTSREEMIADCGICYSYRLMGDIPDQSCDNSHCAQTFHRTCLSEWLRSLPSSRLSFNVLFGECPFCKKPITVKVFPS